MVEKKRIDKFGDLIVLRISLINEIRGLIEKILRIQGCFRSKLQEIKVQGPLCKRRCNAGLITIWSRGPIEKC